MRERDGSRLTYLAQTLILVLGALVVAVGSFARLGTNLATTLQGIGTGLIGAALVSLTLLLATGDPFRLLLGQIGKATENLERRISALTETLADARDVGLDRVWGSRTASEHDAESLWIGLLAQAASIDICAYAAEFLVQDNGEALEAAVRRGARVRVLLGCPDGQAILARDAEAPHRTSLPARINASLASVKRVATRTAGAHGSIELKVFDAPLYCSLYRFDDRMLVTLALFASSGADAPTLCLDRHSRRPKPLFEVYAAHFDRLWDNGSHL